MHRDEPFVGYLVAEQSVCFSQNVRFSGAAPADPDDPHPPGRGLARSVEAEVRAAGWDVITLWDWRDCGWSIICDRGRSALEIVVAEIAPCEWMLQIAPVGAPAFVAKLRGWQPTADRSDVHALAIVIHTFLQRHYADLRWRWDGPPDQDMSTPHPTVWPADG